MRARQRAASDAPASSRSSQTGPRAAAQREVQPAAARELGGVADPVELEESQPGGSQVGGRRPGDRGWGRARVPRAARWMPLRPRGSGRRGGPRGGREPRRMEALHRVLPHRFEEAEGAGRRVTASAGRATGRRASQGRGGRRRRRRPRRVTASTASRENPPLKTASRENRPTSSGSRAGPCSSRGPRPWCGGVGGGATPGRGRSAPSG